MLARRECVQIKTSLVGQFALGGTTEQWGPLQKMHMHYLDEITVPHKMVAKQMTIFKVSSML